MTASGQGAGGTSARAEAANVPKPIAAGPEMKALGRFYRDFTWKASSTQAGWARARPR